MTGPPGTHGACATLLAGGPGWDPFPCKRDFAFDPPGSHLVTRRIMPWPEKGRTCTEHLGTTRRVSVPMCLGREVPFSYGLPTSWHLDLSRSLSRGDAGWSSLIPRSAFDTLKLRAKKGGARTGGSLGQVESAPGCGARAKYPASLRERGGDQSICQLVGEPYESGASRPGHIRYPGAQCTSWPLQARTKSAEFPGGYRDYRK